MTTNSATVFTQALDPTDFLDYVSEFDQILESGETILAGFTVSPTTEGAALGLEISTTFPPSLETGDRNVLYWLEVEVSKRTSSSFDYDGTQIPIEVTITTNTSRRYQRTFLVTVKHL